jgi:hypothetical protein
VNYGALSDPNTTDVTGIVNNGNLSRTLYNHNNTYTQGFSLVGNPYPSPIDWNAPGWTKTNIDNAIYLFKSSTMDQYGGSYSSYINGISSDGEVNNIIPSMQGFLVHVSNGAFPVTGTLGVSNSVRITDQTHPFAKSSRSESAPLIRLAAVFADDNSSTDPLVLYFSEGATSQFESELDALKLFNTDLSKPNIYVAAEDGTKQSITAMPELQEFTSIPLGLKLNRQGNIIFRIAHIDDSFNGLKIVLADVAAGIEQDLQPDKTYTLSLDKGEYTGRFFLNITANATGDNDIPTAEDKFSVFSTNGILRAQIGIINGNRGTLRVYNLTGQLMFLENVYDIGYHEFNTRLKNGIYVVTYTTGTYSISKKLYIESR